jgi:hypothetical protein
VRACEKKLGEEGGIVSSAVIPSPHKDLISSVL